MCESFASLVPESQHVLVEVMMNTAVKKIRISIAMIAAGLLAVLTPTGFCVAQETKPAPKITYDEHAKPILQQRCSSCHSSNRKEGDLDVTNYTNLMVGGGSGEVISPGSTAESYLYKLITHEDSPEMPPSGTKIPEAEIKKLADWINQGALENAGSQPLKAKPKMDFALAEAVTTRPETVAVPLRMPLEPVIRPARPSATAMATSPWAPLAAVAAPKQVLLYDTQSLELLGVLPMGEGLAHSLRFSRNGSLLLAGGGKDGMAGRTILWDVKTGDRIATIGDELDTVLASDISSNHEWVALGGPQKLVKIFSTSDGSLLFELKKHTDWVTAIEFSPDGKYLATGDRNGGLHVWDPETGSEIFMLKGHAKSIAGLSWRSDSRILASASEDTTVRTWEMKKGRQVKTWGAHSGGATAIEFLRDGNIATCGRDKLAKTWDQQGKMIRQFAGLSDVSMAVSFCDETNRVLCSDWTGEIRVWNGSDGSHVGNLVANPPTLEERLAEARERLAVATEKHQPLDLQLQESQGKMSEVTAALDATKQMLSEKQQRLDESTQELAAANKQYESTTTQQAQWRTELEQTKLAKPLIEETYAKAVAAANALPADVDLQQTVAQLKSKQEKVISRIEELKGLVAKTVEEEVSTKSKMEQLGVVINTDRDQVQDLTSQVTQLESEISSLADQVDEETRLADAAKQELANAQTLIGKWQSNLDFIQQLKELNSQLTDTEQVVQEHQSVVDAAHQKLLEAQQLVDEAKQQKQLTEQEANRLRQKILSLRGDK